MRLPMVSAAQASFVFAVVLLAYGMKKAGHLDFEKRAREKQAARDADEADLVSGRRSGTEISHSNNMFTALGPSALKNARMKIPEKK